MKFYPFLDCGKRGKTEITTKKIKKIKTKKIPKV